MNEKLRVEVSEHKKLKENLVYLADYDPLTNLFNRRRFQKEIDDLLAYSRRYGVEGHYCSLIWIISKSPMTFTATRSGMNSS